MTPELTRIHRRVDELAAEYANKGYSIKRPTSSGDLPHFLRNAGYIPDLIVTSRHENLIVEVKTRESVHLLERLAPISELVNSQAGWQFVLVLTNPRERKVAFTHINLSRVQELLARVSELGSRDEAHTEASFLFAWAALESLLRSINSKESAGPDSNSPWTLIRNSTMAGVIAREDALRLQDLSSIRNALVHGADQPLPRPEDVQFLQKLIKGILASSLEPPHAAYRRRLRQDTWHFCSNCSTWPTSAFEETSIRPEHDMMCNECLAKQFSGECR